jgi:HEPN domain-containing protein
VSAVSLSVLAEEHLSRARQALESGDETSAVLWSSMCAEVAITCIGARNGIDVRNDHFQRASAARRLFEMGILPDDLADLLIRLNNERKQATYDAKLPDLRGRTWQQVMDCLAQLVAVAADSEGPTEVDGRA